MLVNTPSRYYNAISYLVDMVESHSHNNPLEITVDYETNGLDVYHGDRICGIAIECKGKCFYFPFRHGIGMGEMNIPLDRISDIGDILEVEWTVHLGHNYKFDIQMAYADGIQPPMCIEDTQLAAHLMNENEYLYKNDKIVSRGGRPVTMYRLKGLSDRYLGGSSSAEESELERKLVKVWKYATTMKEAKGRMWMLAPEHVAPYAIQDVVLTRRLRNFYVPHLHQWRLYDIWQESNEYEIVATWMEIHGMYIDVKLMHQYMEEVKPQLQDRLRKLWEIAGYELNPRSNPQVASLLGMKSTAKEKLELHRGSEEPLVYNPNYTLGEAIAALEEYRAFEKVNVNYYEKFDRMKDYNDVIHTSIHMTGTISGRWSMSNPPMQAIPVRSDIYKVKDVFVARPGYILVEADQSQAEMRIANHYTKDPVMREKIMRGADLHTENAEELGIPRNAAKRIGFGCNYGIGKVSLARQLHCTEAVAAQYLNKYHFKYKGFRILGRTTEAMAENRGYVRMWTGRCRRYGMYSPTHKAMSNIIQGAVAEIIRICILRCYRELTPMGVRLLLQVHDSIVFEIPEDIIHDVLPRINKLMTDFDFDVPLRVDIKYGKSWGTMREWEEGV